MKFYVMIYIMFFAALQLTAQQESKKELFVFTITGYIVAAGDSITVVQVQMPAGAKAVIEKGQAGLLRRNFTNDNTDTAKTGWGKCSLIKSDYYYFGLHLYDPQKKPQKNDLIYTMVNYPVKYKGRIYGMVKNAVYFEHVTGGNFYDFNTPATLNEQQESSLIDSLVADIKFTGKEMLQQNNGQDQDITGGIFNGKKLFTAMQIVTNANVKDFLDYVIARPQKYAGNTWKIAETFATWMVSNTPTVIRE
ncbi:hypothetical protein [Ferruginibacter sp. SUN106]|uniref:hypothetical protein n=1 Tax=Ferruginibacter sp. SUN106 TaxID=2978348 RepID=UPI003D36521C